MNSESLNCIVDLQHVSAGYNGVNVLKEISMRIHARDFIGLIGPNGSGKTTLLKVILGLIQPAEGTIRYSLPDAMQPQRHIGYVPQVSQYDLSFPVSVLDVVLSGLTGQIGLFRPFTRSHRAEALRVLSRLGLSGMVRSPLGRLSGGQAQRVFLARALVSHPVLLVLDEPDSYLDKEFERHFFEILRELNHEIAIILVSHDLGMISTYVKSIACLTDTLHIHDSNEITQELLDQYHCPIDLITHGDVPHRVLKRHNRTHG